MPACPECGERMRLVSIEPLFHYTNLDQHSYICECGEASRIWSLAGKPLLMDRLGEVYNLVKKVAVGREPYKPSCVARRG
jgi:hypothetical protein